MADSGLKKSSANWEEVQMKTFTKWVNSHLAKRDMHIDDLKTGFEDGIALINLIEIVYKIPSIGKYNRNPKLRPHKIDNLALACRFINAFTKRAGILTQVSPEDILDGNLKSILGMNWVMIHKYSMSVETEEVHQVSEKEAMLQWCNARTGTVEVRDFTKSWTDGKAFCALVSSYGEESFTLEPTGDPVTDLGAAFDYAEKTLGVPSLLDPEDFVGGADEKSVMTYIGYLRRAEGDAKKEFAEKLEQLKAFVETANDEFVKTEYKGTFSEFRAACDNYRELEDQYTQMKQLQSDMTTLLHKIAPAGRKSEEELLKAVEDSFKAMEERKEVYYAAISQEKQSRPPTIVSINPSAVRAGQQKKITVNGTHFRGPASVTIGGQACSDVQVDDENTITCITPAAAPSSEVVVTVDGVASQPLTQGFTFSQGEPIVESLFPRSAVEGDAEGGRWITVKGDNFQEGARVFIGDQECTDVTVVDEQTIKCKTPVGLKAGHGDVTVRIGDTVSGALTEGFTCLPSSPVVERISPAKGAANRSRPVTVMGRNFVTKSEASVRIGGKECTDVVVLDSQHITCLSPPDLAPGQSDVEVSIDGHTCAPLASGFESLDTPVVTSINPGVLVAGGIERITVKGENFAAPATITLDGVECSNVKVIDSNTIECDTSPKTTPTQGTTAVVVVDGVCSQPLKKALTLLPAPVVSAVTPSVGPSGSAVKINIEGDNFVGTVEVLIGQSKCTNVSVTGPTTLSCDTPIDLAPGNTEVVVLASGVPSLPLVNGYRCQAAPMIASVDPGDGEAGSAFTVEGKNFLGDVKVFVDGVECEGVQVSEDGSTITANAPTNKTAVTNGNVVVVVDGVESKPFEQGFTYSDVPAVYAVEPANISKIMPPSGKAITIHGQNFQSAAGADDESSGVKVFVGDIECTDVEVTDDSTIECCVPMGVQPADLDVKVVIGGVESRILANSFHVKDAPVLDSVSPAMAAVGRRRCIMVTGDNFFEPARVQIGGQDCSGVEVWDEKTISCLAPAGKAEGMVAAKVIVDGVPSKPLEKCFAYSKGPVIDCLEPNHTAVGRERKIVIIGSNFGDVGEVSIGGVECGFSPIDNSHITCVVPDSLPEGSHTVVVSSDDLGSSALPDGFRALRAPVVTSVSPVEGGPNEEVIIKGDNFAGSAQVTIGGLECSHVLTVDANTIKCQAPSSDKSEAASVVVIVDGVCSEPSEMSFQLLSAPVIESISPPAAPQGKSKCIRITGDNFAGPVSVSIGGEVVDDLVVESNTTLRAVTPASLQIGAHDVIVSVGSASSSPASGAFEVVAPPEVKRVAPDFICARQQLKIHGSGFFGPAVVQIGDTECTDVVVENSHTISCLAPPNLSDTCDQMVVVIDGVKSKPLVGGFQVSKVPVVDAVAPKMAAANRKRPITIIGNNFSSRGCEVVVGGVKCSDITVTNSQHITCFLPDTLNPGHHSVCVTIDGVSAAPLENGFVTLEPPELVSVSPSEGGPGTNVVVKGKNLSSPATVTIGGSDCVDVVVVGEGEKHASILCKVDAAPDGTGASNVVAIVDGVPSRPLLGAFTLKKGPHVERVDVVEGEAPGTVRIVGANFGGPGADVSVEIGGQPCTDVVVEDDNHIRCVVAEGLAGGKHDVKVTVNGASSDTLSEGFARERKPELERVVANPNLPAHVQQEISLIGKNFVSGKVNIFQQMINEVATREKREKEWIASLKAKVTIGGVPCTNVRVLSNCKIVCTTPVVDPFNSGQILVEIDGVTSEPVDAGYLTFEFLPPTITSVTPAIEAGKQTPITIVGNNFGKDCVVTVDGVPCTGVQVIDQHHIKCWSPVTAEGATNAIVVTTNGMASSPLSLEAKTVAAPVVTSIEPAFGVAGDEIVVVGQHLSGGAATVTIGGVACQEVTVDSDNQIRCIVPEDVGKGGAVVAVVDGVCSAPLESGFAGQGLNPVVEKISPAVGVIGSGQTITIKGDNFEDPATVTIGGIACTDVKVIDPYTITCKTPAELSVGANAVVVSCNGVETEAPTAFKSVDAPTVGAVTFHAGPEGAKHKFLRIAGENFVGQVQVTIGGKKCNHVRVDSDNQITCAVPANFSGENVEVTVSCGGVSCAPFVKSGAVVQEATAVAALPVGKAPGKRFDENDKRTEKVEINFASDQDQQMWKKFLVNHEHIVQTSFVVKKGKSRMKSSTKRQLVLTDRPRLFYVDPKAMEHKGNVLFARDLHASYKNARNFTIQTKQELIEFEDASCQGARWCDNINKMVKVWEAKKDQKSGHNLVVSGDGLRLVFKKR